MYKRTAFSRNRCEGSRPFPFFARRCDDLREELFPVIIRNSPFFYVTSEMKKEWHRALVKGREIERGGIKKNWAARFMRRNKLDRCHVPPPWNCFFFFFLSLSRVPIYVTSLFFFVALFFLRFVCIFARLSYRIWMHIVGRYSKDDFVGGLRSELQFYV